MSLQFTLELTAYICALLALLQSFEYLYHSKKISDDGVWRWEDLKFDYSPALISSFLSVFLKPKSFLFLQGLRIILAIMIFVKFHPYLVFSLLIFHILSIIRFRGTYNGGSDYMNLLVLVCLNLALFFKDQPKIIFGALCYLSIQLILSYFKAGYLKLTKKPWRDERALNYFLTNPIYESNFITKFIASKNGLIIVLSWLVLIFELLYPMSILHPALAILFIIMGFFFHLGNVYFFGLNRFLLSWLSAYPALLYCSFQFWVNFSN